MISLALCVALAQRSFPPLAHLRRSVPERRAAFFHAVCEKLAEESDFNSNSIGSMGESGAGAEAMFPAGDSMDMFLLQWEWPSIKDQHPRYVLSEFRLDEDLPVELWRKPLSHNGRHLRRRSTIEKYLDSKGLEVPSAAKLPGLRRLGQRPLAACETNKVGEPYVFFIDSNGKRRGVDSGEVGRSFPESSMERRYLARIRRSGS